MSYYSLLKTLYMNSAKGAGQKKKKKGKNADT